MRRALLTHCAAEALLFEAELRNVFAYPPAHVERALCAPPSAHHYADLWRDRVLQRRWPVPSDALVDSSADWTIEDNNTNNNNDDKDDDDDDDKNTTDTMIIILMMMMTNIMMSKRNVRHQQRKRGARM